MEKNKGGRPRESEAPKLTPMNMRTTPQLREKIERAAEQNARSLTQEVERRLEMSFMSDDLLGGSHNNTFMRMSLAAIAQIEARRGKTWLEDYETFRTVRGALVRLLSANQPEGGQPERDAIGLAFAQWEQAHQRYAKAREQADEYRHELGLRVYNPSSPHYKPLETRPAKRGIFGSRSNLRLADIAASATNPAPWDANVPIAGLAGLLSGEWASTPSDGVTPEQQARLDELEAIAATAFADMQAASARHHAELEAMRANIKKAEDEGREIANEQFRLLGPKRKG